jgi:hypothetical protein
MRWRFVVAYVDPGTGSFLFQLALAGLFGAAYAMKQAWSHFRDHARRLFVRADKRDDR